MIGELAEGSLDIIGDVHGEIESLEALLHVLGYSRHGRHPEGRRLAFVGDLVDRGPDSAAVVRLVSRLIDEGTAQCVLGNHELNILRESRKHDNAWFFEDTDTGTRSEIMQFISERPLALERPGLRVVHACWHQPSIDAARDHEGGVLDLFREAELTVLAELHASGLAAEAERQQSTYSPRDQAKRPQMLHALGVSSVREQVGNPIKVLTSGIERVADEPFWANGKWRFAQRVPWWEDYDDQITVVVGHYWRSRHQGHSFVDEPDLFGDAGPIESLGSARRVMCIDYSIGRRPMERAQVGRTGPFQSALAAYRVSDGQPGQIVFAPV
jgi:hypothetical protein